MTRRCSHCSHNGHNSRTCPNRGVKLFGVRLTDGFIRKSVSMGNLTHYASSGIGSLQNGVAAAHDAAGDNPDHPLAVADGYASEDFVTGSSSCRERKKGTPWTEEEHRMFLLGLQNLGKGDWRGIARNFVVSRTPTQVASHAQKYFIRQTNVSRRKRRSSLFDMIPTDTIDTHVQPRDFLNENVPQPDPDHYDQLSVPAAMDEEGAGESVGSASSNELDPSPSLPENSSVSYPAVYPTFMAPIFPLATTPIWSGKQETHEVFKPRAVHSTSLIKVDELVGMSKLNLGDSIVNAQLPPPPLSLKLVEGSRRQSAFHPNPSSGTIFNLLWPNGVLFSATSAVDRSSLVKYIFPNERLPEWIRFLLQNQKDPRVLAELCPIFKDIIKEDTLNGSPFQVQLSVLEYYMFWFAYYPVYRGNGEGPQPVKVQRSRKFRLENWGYSIPGLSSNKRNAEQKEEGNLYLRLLYAYLRASVPLYNLNAYQPYRSSLLHHSREYDLTFTERAEFLVHVFINFWLIDNCFSPLPLSLCKAYGVSFPFRSLLGETPPTPGLGEVINVFVKYLTLSSIMSANGYQKLDWNGSPLLKTLGSIDAIKPINAGLDLQPTGSWNSWIQRALYRYILRSFLFCPVQTSMKNVSQVFTLWVSYMEPWKISLEEFADIDSMMGMSSRSTLKEVSGTSESCYSPLWQWFVLSNYLYYSSLVMHFIGFAHKFLHTDPEAIVLMVSKVISILTSTAELVDLIRNFDNLFHSKPSGSSKSLLSELYKYVPVIRNELQDWEYGLCESDADGSFLHDNWNKDLKLFSEGEDGGQQLFQLFVLRAEAELHANSSGLQCLDDLKSGLVKLYGGAILTSPTPSGTPEPKETQHAPPPTHVRDDAFRPRNFRNHKVTNVKYKGDWMMRPIGDDEIGWLAVLLVKLSSWLNEILGLNRANTGNEGPVWSYVDLSGEGPVIGVADTMKMVLCSFLSIIVTAAGAVVKLMKNHGLRVNLRVLASKKVAAVLALFVAFSMLKRAIS